MTLLQANAAGGELPATPPGAVAPTADHQDGGGSCSSSRAYLNARYAGAGTAPAGSASTFLKEYGAAANRHAIVCLTGAGNRGGAAAKTSGDGVGGGAVQLAAAWEYGAAETGAPALGAAEVAAGYCPRYSGRQLASGSPRRGSPSPRRQNQAMSKQGPAGSVTTPASAERVESLMQVRA